MEFDFTLGIFFFLLVGVPSFYLTLELIIGVVVQGSFKENTQSREAVTILMPAYNEELIIGGTLQKLIEQVHPGDRIVVIADNCSDKTVEICQNYDVHVIERANLEQSGKGYALDYGFKHISNSPTPTVVILDADSEFADGSLDLLVSRSQQLDVVVQSLYLMKSPEGSSIKTHLAEFAWLVKNQIRPRALNTLGIGCHLQGSGMAFPWRILANQSFASGSIVEDLELGLKLAQNGHKVFFESDARVISYFSTSEQGFETQRTRWEHGHMASIFSQLPQVMLSSLFKRNWSAFFLAMDASIPPTISWLMVVIIFTLVSFVLSFVGIMLPLWISVSSGMALLIALMITWLFAGRKILSFYDLLSTPKYIIGKFSLYRKFVKGREKNWIRTDRD